MAWRDVMMVFLVDLMATQTGGATRVEQVVCGKIDGNIKDAEGQASAPRFEIKLIAQLSAEKIAFPCEVFSKFY